MRAKDEYAEKIKLTGLEFNKNSIVSKKNATKHLFGEEYTNVEFKNSSIEFNKEEPDESRFTLEVVAGDK